MTRFAWLLALAAGWVPAGAVQAQYYTTYYQPATVYYSAPADACCGCSAPATTATTTYYAPTTTYYAPAPTVTYYAPTTTYYPAPVYYTYYPRWRWWW
jgi:hypothetical protein